MAQVSVNAKVLKMETAINIVLQSMPVLISLLTGVWFLSNKFNVVEKKCDLIEQKVDFLSEKVRDVENSTESISNNLHSNTERFSSNISNLDRRILKLEITSSSRKAKNVS